jgi:hypothetical protein
MVSPSDGADEKIAGVSGQRPLDRHRAANAYRLCKPMLRVKMVGSGPVAQMDRATVS